MPVSSKFQPGENEVRPEYAQYVGDRFQEEVAKGRKGCCEEEDLPPDMMVGCIEQLTDDFDELPSDSEPALFEIGFPAKCGQTMSESMGAAGYTLNQDFIRENGPQGLMQEESRSGLVEVEPSVRRSDEEALEDCYRSGQMSEAAWQEHMRDEKRLHDCQTRFDNPHTYFPLEEPTLPDLGTNPKDIIGVKKPSARFTPFTALIYLYKVMEFGAKKYGEMNWRANKVQAKVYLDAADRHLMLLADGEDIDTDSALHHAGHVMACMAIYIDALETGNLIDDRNKTGTVRRLLDKFTTN